MLLYYNLKFMYLSPTNIVTPHLINSVIKRSVTLE